MQEAMKVSSLASSLKNTILMLLFTLGFPPPVCWTAGGDTCGESGVCSSTSASSGSSASSSNSKSSSGRSTTTGNHSVDDDGDKCGVDSIRCSNHLYRSLSIYQYGGTAQAYKPNVPLDQSICDTNKYSTATATATATTRNHKVASWPLSRVSRSTSSSPPPILELNISFYKNCITTKTRKQDSRDDCCCESLGRTTKTKSLVVEAWQARPDGTYASLRPGKEDGDCRARAILGPLEEQQQQQEPQASLLFRTVAPGSVGSLGGLVPFSWLDWIPYKPPILHLLVSVVDGGGGGGLKNITPLPLLLMDLPILFHPKTLEPRKFSNFWQGPTFLSNMAMANSSVFLRPFQITSWIPNLDKNLIQISLDVFLSAASPSHDLQTKNRTAATPQDFFCNSLPFGFPLSFFLEPMAICSSSMLDFFDL